MSLQAHRMHRSTQHHCPCGRPARYRTSSNSHYRARRGHALCAQCWRSGLDRARVQGRRGVEVRA